MVVSTFVLKIGMSKNPRAFRYKLRKTCLAGQYGCTCMNEPLHDMYGNWSIAKNTVPMLSQIRLFGTYKFGNGLYNGLSVGMIGATILPQG